uniref:DNA-directed DNA polymerase n=1 Tax=Strigamia maritima TaxID=126957 RepID=T1IGU4_STRMM
MKMFRSAGYVVNEIWECEFNHQINCNSELAAYIDLCNYQDPIYPKLAYFGGRVECYRMYCESIADAKIKYKDICSLYLFCMRQGIYPLGLPMVLTEFSNNEIKNIQGLIKATVLPPFKLYHPVLPFRYEQKLYFPLCRQCVIDQCSKCDHDVKQRSITGTWVSLELQKAVEVGYVIVKLHEAWHFDKVSKFDPDIHENGLFKEYIDVFLTLKQQASGYPADCLDEKAYMQDYFENQGILLDPSKIEKNVGLRTLSKISLNALYGKLGQRSDVDQVTYCIHPREYFAILMDDSKVKRQIQIFGWWYCIPSWYAAHGDRAISYTFLQKTLPVKEWTPLLSMLRDAVSRAAGCDFNFVLMINRYRDGWDTADRENVDPNAPTAWLSFGQCRKFVIS